MTIDIDSDTTELPDPWATPAGFLRERRDFLQVRVVPGEESGFDVVLRIDGTYLWRGDAVSVAEYIEQAIHRLQPLRRMPVRQAERGRKSA